MAFYRRAVAVIKHLDLILLLQEGEDTYWILPGGEAKHGEPFLDACIRELGEELDFHVEAEQLRCCFVMENFFALQGADIHEVCVGFGVEVESIDCIDTNYLEPNQKRKMKWFDKESLSKVFMLPEKIKEHLISNCFSCGIER